MTPSRFPLRLGLAVLPLLCAALPAVAAQSDRNQQMVIEADRDSVVDLQRQVVTYAGNVVITQGSLQLRADRVEMRELPSGWRTATALGTSGKPATWRQRRDGGLDETVEGQADRIDYDGRADTIRFTGNAAVRRLRAGVMADEITGGTIVWDNTAEVFRVEGGTRTPVNPTGRVRAVLSPQPAPASAASAAAPATPAAPSGTLTPSRGISPPTEKP